jgi:hypothetical protein
MLWLQSSMSTVAHDDWYSHWCTSRSAYPMSMGEARPRRRIEFRMVVLASRFKVSPNS